jgi:hypothetical protein
MPLLYFGLELSRVSVLATKVSHDDEVSTQCTLPKVI